MSPLIESLRIAADDLASLGADHAVIGGLAVSVRGTPRFTRDADLVIAVPGDEAAEALVHALVGKGYGILATVDHEITGRLATVRLSSRIADGVVVDLLFASSGIESEIIAIAERLEIAKGLVLPVARIGHLIALKVLSQDETRLQDRIDLRELASVAVDADWLLAEDACRLITVRGFHRDRDLAALLRAERTG